MQYMNHINSNFATINKSPTAWSLGGAILNNHIFSKCLLYIYWFILILIYFLLAHHLTYVSHQNMPCDLTYVSHQNRSFDLTYAPQQNMSCDLTCVSHQNMSCDLTYVYQMTLTSLFKFLIFFTKCKPLYMLLISLVPCRPFRQPSKLKNSLFRITYFNKYMFSLSVQ
jgi:hypothetical protein